MSYFVNFLDFHWSSLLCIFWKFYLDCFLKRVMSDTAFISFFFQELVYCICERKRKPIHLCLFYVDCKKKKAKKTFVWNVLVSDSEEKEKKEKLKKGLESSKILVNTGLQGCNINHKNLNTKLKGKKTKYTKTLQKISFIYNIIENYLFIPIILRKILFDFLMFLKNYT